MDSAFKWDIQGVCATKEKSATGLLVETCAQVPLYSVMSEPVFRFPVVKMSWEKNSKKKPILLFNFCFMIHFDFFNTRIFHFLFKVKSWTLRCHCDIQEKETRLMMQLKYEMETISNSVYYPLIMRLIPGVNFIS